MRLPRPLRAAAVALVLPLAACGGGSGGSEPPARPLDAEQQAVAEANAICADYTEFARAWRARVGPYPGRPAIERLLLVRRAAAARHHGALVAGAAQPRIRSYLHDVASRERLLARLRRVAGARVSSRGHSAGTVRLLRDLYAVAARTYATGEALGLSGCIGVRPRPPERP